MEFEIKAGAKLDVLNRREMRDVLHDWQVETMRGIIPVRFSAQGTIAANAVTIDGSDNSGRLGPEAGMVWCVTRVVVSGLTNASDPTSLFVNSNSPWNLVLPSLTGVAGSSGYHEFSSNQVVLQGNDRLVLASTGAVAATGRVTLAGQAWEMPAGLMWRLL